MPKKEEYQKGKSIEPIKMFLSILEKQAVNLISWLEWIAVLPKKIKSLLAAMVLFTAGMGVLGIGIGLYLSHILPNLPVGVPHIIVGVSMVLIALVYSLSSR